MAAPLKKWITVHFEFTEEEWEAMYRELAMDMKELEKMYTTKIETTEEKT